MKHCTLLILSSSVIMLYYSTLSHAQGTELTPWSQWACFNSTVASRNRTLQNCSDVEYIDPVTNMTTTNRSCDNRTETDRRTDVVSENTWSTWSPMVTCGATGTITQNRTLSCQRASLQCLNNCTGGRLTQRTVTVPLCCAQQMYSDWTSWKPPGCSPSAPIQQTRQRSHIPCDQNVLCEPNCTNITETRIVAQTIWGLWGPWSSTQVPMCGAGQRSRQRVCTNTTLIHCAMNCTLGSIDIDNQCCVVRNIWSTWSAWSQTTNSGQCPDTRTRTRSCVADPSVVGVNATQLVCVGTCSLNFTEKEPQRVDTARCENGTLATNTGEDSSFPTWAIGVVSAIGVILVVGGFVAITIGGRYLTRRRQYSIGEGEKEYEKMNVPSSAYQPTESFSNYNAEGIPGTTGNDALKYTEPYEEKQL